MGKVIVTGPPLASKFVDELTSIGFTVVNGSEAFLRSIGIEAGATLRDLTQDEAAKALADADIYIYGGLEAATTEILVNARNLRLIAFLGTGWADPGCIDRSVTNLGIAVTNTPGANAASVAEVTMGLIIALQRQIVFLNNRTKDSKALPVRLKDIASRRLGVVGLGAIGSRVATHAKFGFNMDVVYSGPHPKPELERKLGLRRLPLDELLSSSDFVTLHCPARTTGGLIGHRELGLMKKTAFLVNCCSPEVVKGDALVSALKTNVIAGAAFDGFYKEPEDLKTEFLNLPDDKLIVLPRTAWLTDDSYTRMAEMAVKGIREFVSGRDPLLLVNPDYKRHFAARPK